MDFQHLFSQKQTASTLWNSLLEDQAVTHEELEQQEQENALMSPENAIETNSMKLAPKMDMRINWTNKTEDLELFNDDLGPSHFIDQLEQKHTEDIPSIQFEQPHKVISSYIPGEHDNQISACSTQPNISSADLFEPKDLRKQYKKNTNIPKFLVRIYLKHFPTANKNTTTKLIQFYKRTKRSLKHRVSNNYTIKDLQSLFQANQQSTDQLISVNNREVMASIITNKATQQINDNNYIRGNQLSYMIALKVYNLRCRSSDLTQRVKIF